MSPRNWQDRLQDIVDAIEEVNYFVENMTLKVFQGDAKTIRAVELDFIIIGEAANAIPMDIQEKYSDVPWDFMRALRNRLVHVYFAISPEILWETIQQDLPVTLALVKAVLIENR
jgi:uncharacterized protein with HEPN domain